MMQVLVCYASTEGQTKNVALQLKELLPEYTMTLLDANDAYRLPLADYDAFIVAASVHHWEHQTSILNFVRDNLKQLNQSPSCFLSLSLSAALPDEQHQAEAKSYAEKFLKHSSWQPSSYLCVAGALRYKGMDYFRQTLANLILERTLGTSDIDLSQDYDFTDYDEVHDFVKAFLVKAKSDLTLSL